MGLPAAGLRPLRVAATSSAAGLFQFVEGTWLQTLKEEGPSLGLGQYSAQIAKRAKGRYQVADQPPIWWCEPNGVSIRYYRGHPLGILLAAVRPEVPAAGRSPLITPTTIGLAATLTPKHSGTLFFRINDSCAELDDNAGTLTADVQDAGPAAEE